jgi:hypothetical protein
MVSRLLSGPWISVHGITKRMQCSASVVPKERVPVPCQKNKAPYVPYVPKRLHRGVAGMSRSATPPVAATRRARMSRRISCVWQSQGRRPSGDLVGTDVCILLSHLPWLVRQSLSGVARPGTPRSACNLNEVSFNAVLLKELRMIALLRKVPQSGEGESANWARMHIHRILSYAMVDLGYSSKFNAE